MSAITLPGRETGQSRGRERSPARKATAAKRRTQERLRPGSVDLSNGDPEYVMLWGADNADPRPGGDSRR